MFVDGGLQRHKVINILSFLYDDSDNLQSNIAEYNLDNPTAQLDISATKEYILKHNLGSFENDW
jgi:hypothetical protein